MKTKIRRHRISSARDEEMEQEETHNDQHMRKSLQDSTNSSSDDEANKKDSDFWGWGEGSCVINPAEVSSSDEADTKEDEPRETCALSGCKLCKSARRSPTLSPPQKLEHLVSPVKSSQPPESLRSSYLRKVSLELSPSHVKKVLHTKFLSRRSTGKVLPSLPVIDENKNRFCVPFNKKGYCHIHSDVQLAKVDKKGMWIGILDVCPQCEKQSKPARTRSSSSDQKYGKVHRLFK